MAGTGSLLGQNAANVLSGVAHRAPFATNPSRAYWRKLLDAADEIFADDCLAHTAPSDIGEPPVYRGPNEMRNFVELGSAIFNEVTFQAEGDPIVESDHLATRWTAEGTYAGGMPGATASPGAPITFRGVDVWRIENGKVTEYWVSSDGLHLMAQLGVVKVG